MRRLLKALFVGELTWRRLIRSLILIPIAVILGLLIIAIFFADRLIFHPLIASYHDNSGVIKIRTICGETISAKYYENPRAEYTILFSHGNAEDLGTIEPFIQSLQNSGFSVLAYDYQGYGTSSGFPAEESVYADVSSAFNYLLIEKRIKPSRIILHGRSLGGAVSVDLASREKVGGLILESTFTSAFRVVTRYRVLPFDKFESIKKIKNVSSPVLVIHGSNDRLIPTIHGKQLFEAANGQKFSLWLEGAGHNDVFFRGQDLYLDAIKEFTRVPQKD